jgi:ADP-L-glycero-D-manno-heptose 6-epimerase
MIVVTGAAGFIGSCLVAELNMKGIEDLILVDDFSNPAKAKNLEGKNFREKIDRAAFAIWLSNHYKEVEFIYHIGARTDTTEFDTKVFDRLNLNYSKKVWTDCTIYGIPLIYASSAATYGDGKLGYRDDISLIPQLQPLNPYGISKNEFDKWVILQKETPPFWYGLKFFNVFGPNEYHKGRMASVVFHAFNQIKAGSSVNLFRSHKPEYKDGEQLRDFIYVMDVINVMEFLRNLGRDSGIYNLGTGRARTFLDLVTAVFQSMTLSPVINFVDTPEDIREKYQYFTEADMTKLISIGYTPPFSSLEDAIMDYVQGFLRTGKYR